MIAENFEARLLDWAKRRPDVRAIVVAGSRARQTGGADKWSDWDLHLVTSTPARYYGVDWLPEIAPVWCASSQLTPRGVVKVSAVFEDGLEVDFLPLASWQMKLVYLAMRHAAWKDWLPSKLVRGIWETRSFLMGSGHRVLHGGPEWESRISAALSAEWPARTMGELEFLQLTEAFWQKAAWVAKKIARPEPRSAMHWLHKIVTDEVFTLLAEEARLGGRVSRPEARKAEQWLDEKRLGQTEMVTSTDQHVLAKALLRQIELFEEVSASVARSRGFSLRNYSAVTRWLRDVLTPLAREN